MIMTKYYCLKVFVIHFKESASLLWLLYYSSQATHYFVQRLNSKQCDSVVIILNVELYLWLHCQYHLHLYLLLSSLLFKFGLSLRRTLNGTIDLSSRVDLCHCCLVPPSLEILGFDLGQSYKHHCFHFVSILDLRSR